MADDGFDVQKPDKTPEITEASQSSISGMFDRWNERSRENPPRVVTGEDPVEVLEETLDEKTVGKRLAGDYIDALVKLDSVRKESDGVGIIKNGSISANGDWKGMDVGFYYDIDDVSKSDLSSNEQYLSIIYGFNSTQQVPSEGEIPRIMGPEGISMPMLFLGNDGRAYSMATEYRINPNTGNAVKTGFAIPELELSPTDREKLPTFSYENKSTQEFGLVMQPEDFEKLGTMLDDLQKGKIDLHVVSDSSS